MAKKGSVQQQEPTDPKAAILAMGCRAVWEFESRMERGGFFLVGFAGFDVVIILQEHYEGERDNITSRQVFVPLDLARAPQALEKLSGVL